MTAEGKKLADYLTEAKQLTKKIHQKTEREMRSYCLMGMEFIAWNRGDLALVIGTPYLVGCGSYCTFP